jgi:hypothetical protein
MGRTPAEIAAGLGFWDRVALGQLSDDGRTLTRGKGATDNLACQGLAVCVGTSPGRVIGHWWKRTPLGRAVAAELEPRNPRTTE